MRRIILILAAVTFVVGFSATTAVGDWKQGDGHKMHFPQLPDEAGWDVNATKPLVLADDWMCSETGPVTDIHFWGSWLNGLEGVITSFTLSIHADIPADPPQIPYSKPGATLWETTITNFAALPIDPPFLEGWYDPQNGQFLAGNHQAYFQYNVLLPKEDWFVQTEGTIYWLNISATVEDPGAPPQPVWGWKSTLNHWNDDAVWGIWGELIWDDMFEPPDFLQSLDLSFVITGGLDYGDAPDHVYLTLLASDGARHAILPGFYLGAGVDTEPDGQPDPNALGDDNDGNDDEDGVVFKSGLVPGRSVNVAVTASTGGFLDAWVDFNDNNDWADAGEQIFTSQALSAGVNSLSFTVPASATITSQTFARFRLSSVGGLSYTGAFEDGEVEDYEVAISQPPKTLAPIYLLLLD